MVRIRVLGDGSIRAELGGWGCWGGGGWVVEIRFWVKEILG